MKSPEKTKSVLAAGGIVVRDAPEPLIALVRLRKDKNWVLPKGKLKPNEEAVAAAEREVKEETGHDVEVHEFLGAMSHAADSKHKVVQFWRMRAVGGQVRELMRDVKAVKWLPLDQAIEALSRPHEKAFLANVGPAAIRGAGPAERAPVAIGGRLMHVTLADRLRAWFGRLTQDNRVS
jgi:8-oxo-dGTP diphosphatase